MRQFVDTKQRTWAVQMDVSAFRRVRDLIQVDLLHGNLLETAEKVVSDPMLLCDCLYAICQPQAIAMGVSSEDFGAGLYGDVIDVAARVMMEEIADFSPNQMMRDALRKAIAMAWKRLGEAHKENAETIEAAIRAESTSGQSSGVSPVSSDATPEP